MNGSSNNVWYDVISQGSNLLMFFLSKETEIFKCWVKSVTLKCQINKVFC